MKYDTPASSESWTRMLVHGRSGGILRRSAHTGAPACASTTLTPTARSSVLLPDMFDPVTIRKPPGGPTVTSFATRRSAAIRGWPSPRASRTADDSSISGKAHDGLSCLREASAASASNCPSAAYHRRRCGPARLCHCSSAANTWKSHSVTSATTGWRMATRLKSAICSIRDNLVISRAAVVPDARSSSCRRLTSGDEQGMLAICANRAAWWRTRPNLENTRAKVCAIRLPNAAISSADSPSGHSQSGRSMRPPMCAARSPTMAAVSRRTAHMAARRRVNQGPASAQVEQIVERLARRLDDPSQGGERLAVPLEPRQFLDRLLAFTDHVRHRALGEPRGQRGPPGGGSRPPEQLEQGCVAEHVEIVGVRMRGAGAGRPGRRERVPLPRDARGGVRVHLREGGRPSFAPFDSAVPGDQEEENDEARGPGSDPDRRVRRRSGEQGHDAGRASQEHDEARVREVAGRARQLEPVGRVPAGRVAVAGGLIAVRFEHRAPVV